MKEQLITQLSDLIREKGFASLSISDIALATHLSKSSLYHHFPGGKVEMAQAVMEAALQSLGQKFSEVLENKKPAKQQLTQILKLLSDFYHAGEKNCLVDVMSVAPADPIIQAYLDKILAALLNVFTQILLNHGANKKTAHTDAVIIVSLLQGGLVLARASQNSDYFKKVVKQIQESYCH